MICAARKRWKIENEGFNSQKNGIYDIEHLKSQNTNGKIREILLNRKNLFFIADMVEKILTRYSLYAIIWIYLWKRNLKGTIYMTKSEMIVEIGMSAAFILFNVIWYLSIKINSVKTVGICKVNFDCYHGYKGMFEYEIDGIKHYNREKKAHFGKCKVDKEYTIYVDKNNYEKFVSRKFLSDLMFFIILFGISFISACSLAIIGGINQLVILFF